MNPTDRSRYGFDLLDPYAPGPDWLDVAERAGEAGFRGTALIAPPSVDLSRRDALPFALLAVSEGELDFPGTSATSVLVTRLESRTTWCATLREIRDRPKRPAAAPADDDAPVKPGLGVAIFHFELRARVPDLPWRPATLVLRLVRNGLETDPVTVRLERGALEHDLEARTLLDARPAPAPETFPSPPPRALMPWSAETPRVPPPDALALHVTAVDLVSNPPVVIARGAYTLPVRQIERVPAHTPYTLPDGRQVAARIPLSLVITGPELAVPVVLQVLLDAHVLIEHDGWPTPLPEGDLRGRVQGQFNLNLGAFWEFPRAPGRYWVRAVIGAFDTGPQPYTVLDSNLSPLEGDEPA